MDDVYLVTVDAWRHDAVESMPRLQSRASNWEQRTMICTADATDWVFPAILNGRYYPNVYDRNRRLLSGTRPLPEILAENGYETAAVVASNANLNPWEDSFDFFWNDGLTDESTSRNQNLQQTTAEKMRVNAERAWLTATFSKRVPATQAAKVAKEWKRTKDPSTPKFVWIHLMEPHEPYYPGLSKAREVGLLKSYYAALDYFRRGDGGSASTLETMEELYWKCIKKLDERLAAVLDFIPSDARAVIAADHGEAFTHGTGHGVLYDEIVKVPAFFQNVDVPQRTVGQINLPAYILDALDIPVPESWASDLTSSPHGFPLVGGPKQTCRYVGYRTDTYKIIRKLSLDGTRTKETEVYDLDADPEEQENLYHDEDWSRLEARVDDVQSNLDLTKVTRPDVDLSESVERRLRELGYR